MPDLPTLPALTRFPMLPAFPNPIDQLGQGLGASMAALAASAFDQAMKSLWDFALALLGSVLGVIDHLTTPNLDPRTGPLASVLPATIWVGAVLLVVLSLVQVAKAALTGGAGLGHLFTGIAQYMIISASALSLLVVLVTAANAAALGILASGLHTSTWQGIATSNTAWQNGVAGVSGAGLGLIALLGVLPAAIGLLVAALVREASILVIAATIPILAAGLVAQVTARWFWTGLRWLFALIMLTPAVAIVLSIGLQLAVGAANATGTSSSDPGQQAVTALVGAAVLLISLFCPLALFKLFAFIDPGTASGQRLRTSLAGNGAGPAPAGGASQSPAGQSSSGAGSPGSGDDASEQIDSRWASAVGKLSAPHRAMASGTQAAMSSAAAVLSAVGVGAGADPDHATGRQQPKPATRSGTSSSPDTTSPGTDTGAGSTDPGTPQTGTDPGVDASTPPGLDVPDPPRPPDPPDLPDPPQPGGGGSGPSPDQPGGQPTPSGGSGPAGGAGGAGGASEAAVIAV